MIMRWISGLPSKMVKLVDVRQFPQVDGLLHQRLPAPNQHPTRPAPISWKSCPARTLQVDEAINEPITSYCRDCGRERGVPDRPARETDESAMSTPKWCWPAATCSPRSGAKSLTFSSSTGFASEFWPHLWVSSGPPGELRGVFCG